MKNAHGSRKQTRARAFDWKHQGLRRSQDIAAYKTGADAGTQCREEPRSSWRKGKPERQAPSRGGVRDNRDNAACASPTRLPRVPMCDCRRPALSFLLFPPRSSVMCVLYFCGFAHRARCCDWHIRLAVRKAAQTRLPYLRRRARRLTRSRGVAYRGRRRLSCVYAVCGREVVRAGGPGPAAPLPECTGGVRKPRARAGHRRRRRAFKASRARCSRARRSLRSGGKKTSSSALWQTNCTRRSSF